MTAQEFLESVGQLEREIAEMAEEIAKVRTMAEGITAQYNSVGGHSGKTTDKVGNAAVRLVQLEKRYAAKIAKYARTQEKTLRLLDKLQKPEHREVLRRKYFLQQTWAEIGRVMFMDPSTARRKNKAALLEFRKIWNDKSME